jgi:uncharacterized protein
MDVDVADNAERQRFEARLAGRLVGVADYHERDGVVAFTHTEVDPELRGQGIGAALVGAALKAAVDRGVRIRPLCSFVADYVRLHPEYTRLVVA